MDSASQLECFKVIEEQIKRNNVVTFKWLSRKLEIHNSVAKELLQEYIDKSKNKNKYIVTLVVYGKKEQGDLLLSLIKENEFSALQNTISIIDKHVYSIQPAESTFNPEMIYNIDKATYELKQLSLSSIKYNKEIIRKNTAVQSTPVTEFETSSTSTGKSTPVVKEELKVKKASPRKQSPKKESPPTKPSKETNSKPEPKKSIVKPVANSKGSISSFFQKQAAKGTPNKTNSTPKNNSSVNQESPVPNDKSSQNLSFSDQEKTKDQVIETKNVKVESSSEPSKDESSKTNGVSKTMGTESLAKKIEQKTNSLKKSQNKSKSKKSNSKKTAKQKKMKRIILQSDSSSESEASENDSHMSEPEPEEEPEPVISLHSTETPDVHVLFVLCILYTQQCLQSEAVDILEILKKQNDNFKNAFIDVAIGNWTFLFENITKNDNELTNFSEFTSVLIENLPRETSEILTKLIKNEIFPLADIVQMLLKQIPCQVSMEKGHLVLQTFLESVFSRKIVTTANDPGVNNCLKILLRSYLTQLRVKVPKNSSSALLIPEPIFGEKLPEYIIYLPVVESCNYVALRKLQDLIWSKLLTEDAVKEVIDTLPNMEIKLNVLAMLNSFDVAKELIKNNCFSVIFPYAKVCFSGVKKWRDLIILVQNRMAEIKDAERSNAEYEEIFDQILDHLSHTMTPSQLNAVLEPIIPKKDDTYWKHIMKAQQISYAKDVKDLIINTSQQLLNSNSLY